MRWTGRIRFLFLAPAVLWVLAFTVFPLGYSLWLAFFKVQRKVQIGRVQVPVLDEQGRPVIEDSHPKTRNVLLRENVTTSTFIGFGNFRRLLGDPLVADAVRVTLVFLLLAEPEEVVLGFCSPFCSTARSWSEASCRWSRSCHS